VQIVQETLENTQHKKGLVDGPSGEARVRTRVQIPVLQKKRKEKQKNQGPGGNTQAIQNHNEEQRLAP
jgi:hypothetical protein